MKISKNVKEITVVDASIPMQVTDELLQEVNSKTCEHTTSLGDDYEL
jgi:DNA polymerase I-like protein with 3'-5' exonuclease and polymerase domains